ncbi:MAG TPA: PPC domain-containing protein [Kofleriaceae bacterium]|nr:PPC domain-containing protein [Kofleriaceae bacterium]
MLFRVTVVSLLMLAACAQGQSGGDGDDVDARVTDAKQDLVDAPSADAPPGSVDAPPAAVDAGTDAPPGAAPDTCAQAQDVTAGAMVAGGITVTGDTTGYVDDVRPASACTGFLPDGPDAIYSVTVNAGVTITAVATPTTTWDISLELVQPCAATPTCLDGADAISGPETVTFTTTAQGTYYIVVDGYNPGVAGPFSLNVRVQ